MLARTLKFSKPALSRAFGGHVDMPDFTKKDGNYTEQEEKDIQEFNFFERHIVPESQKKISASYNLRKTSP